MGVCGYVARGNIFSWGRRRHWGTASATRSAWNAGPLCLFLCLVAGGGSKTTAGGDTWRLYNRVATQRRRVATTTRRCEAPRCAVVKRLGCGEALVCSFDVRRVVVVLVLRYSDTLLQLGDASLQRHHRNAWPLRGGGTRLQALHRTTRRCTQTLQLGGATRFAHTEDVQRVVVAATRR